MTFSIVLVEPEIPHNTGAVGRLCVGLGLSLHLIQPLGFTISKEAVQRSGLDYWDHLDLHVHRCWTAFLEAEQPAALYFMSTKGSSSVYDCQFAQDGYLVFGSESRGFPPEFYEDNAERLFLIPMPGRHARSLNLSNAVAVAAYEAYRQISSS